MPTTLPNREELTAIKAAIKDSNITDPNALALAIDDFSNAEFTAETADAYMVMLDRKLKEKPANGGDLLAEHAELIERAFAGKGNPDARQTLLKTIGQEAADAAAKRFGLASATDFRNLGKVPDGFTPPKDKASSNPWSPTYKGKAPADQERIRLIKTLPTRACQEMARSAGVDLAGRPLRGAAA